jgi:cellulose synthase operon protein C
MPTAAPFIRPLVVGLALAVAAVGHLVTPRLSSAAESSDAARAAYASAAALQNREAWELAGEEWAALLKAHPADPLALKGRYYLAICQLKEDDWPAAEKTLRAVLTSPADADTLALARLELGRGLFRAAQQAKAPQAFAAAAEALELFLAANPKHPQAAEAAHLAGEALWQAGRRDDALAAWQAFLRSYPGAPQTPAVLYALGVGLADEKKYAAAAPILERFAKEHADHRLADDVALWRADVATALDRPADTERIVAAVATGAGPRAADALERLADARWAQKKFPQAAEAYAKLSAGKPGPRTARAAAMAGRSFAEAGRTDEARKWLAEAVAAGGPTGLDAAHRLALLELDAKRPEAALAVADRGLAAAAQEKSADVATLAALALDRADALWAIPGKGADAIDAFAAVADRYPNTPSAGPATSMAALALLRAGKPAESFARADAFLVKHAKAAAAEAVADVRAIRAEALLAQGEHAAAAAAYRELIDASPKSPKRPAWQSREGAALAAAGKWQEAHAALAAAAPGLRATSQAEAMLLDATALVELDKPADAARVLVALDKAHPTWPRRDEALLLAVRALDEAGDSKAALATAERLAKEFPAASNADVAWYRLGQLRQQAGDREAAIAAFTASLDAKPDGSRAPWARLAIGWCHESAGQLDQAIAAWSDLVAKHPGTTAAASGLLARADARQRTGDFAGGLADCQRLLDEGDLAKQLDAAAVAEARFLQALCLAGAEKDAQAAATFKKLLGERPDFPAADRATLEMGLALARSGKQEAAAAAFAALVKQFPQSSYAADAWLELAERRWAAEDWAAAAEAYRAAIAAAGAAPDLALLVEQARHKLGWTHVMQDEDAPAAEAFAAQLAAAPDGPLAADAAALLGDALVSLGKPAEADKAFAKALADPQKLSSEALRGLAFIRAAEAAAGREAWQESLAFAEQLLALEPESPRAAEARYAAAWARQNLGRFDEALAGYQTIAAGPRTELAARAQLMVGEVLFEQHQHKDAIKAFFKAAYGFGEQQAPAAFHPWQAQATFEAARCFEVLKQPEQARKLYAELVERYPTSEHVPASRQRLAALSAAPATKPASPGASS